MPGFIRKSPKYDHLTDDCDAICSYCGDRYQVEGADYAPFGNVIECDECGKSYRLTTLIDVQQTTEPDCGLNGEEHTWALQAALTRGLDTCRICGAIRNHVPEKLSR